ncbi:glutathione S-transferase P 1-like [Pelobates fuscus]|uniref:glutathione S-transferase P 1-like n=1 Tax=Pelobates fuscus TaxID=191477 RepID=UPI002FE4768E
MPGYVLTYFPVRGRAESTRLLLADQGAALTEVEVPIADWFSGKTDLKKNAVFGQLPKFQDEDFVLYQSNAILRYLGHKHGLAGSNDKDTARIDMVNEGVEDLRQKFGKLVFFEFETGKENYIKNLPNQLAPFEKILSQNSNGTKFVVGNKISYADYNLLDILHCHLDLSPTCLTAFPLLAAYTERLAARPQLSTYLKSEKRNKRPITPKHKQ